MGNRDKSRQKLAAIPIPSMVDLDAPIVPCDPSSKYASEPLPKVDLPSDALRSETMHCTNLSAEFGGDPINNASSGAFDFSDWSTRGDFGKLTIAAFDVLYKHTDATRRCECRSYINTFFKYLCEVDKDFNIISISFFTQQHCLLFKDFLDKNEPRVRKRKRTWATFRNVMLEMLGASHATEVSNESIFIQQSPWPGRGARGYTGNGASKDPAWQAVFPSGGGDPPHVFDFSAWSDRGEFGSALIRAFIRINYHLSDGTRGAARAKLRKFLYFLDEFDPEKKITTIPDFKSEYARSFKEFLDRAAHVDRFRAKVWYCFRATMGEMVHELYERKGYKHKIIIVHRPWGRVGVNGVITEALSMGEAAAILKACVIDMRRVMQDAERLGPHYQGPSVAQLLPFIVTLAFWTLFNPDSMLALTLKNVRPPILGRIAIVVEKGRSNREQVATFPENDTHICSPPVLIRNIIKITSVLRRLCRDEIKDCLFIGRVLNTNAINEIDAYANLTQSTQLNHRKRFIKQHNVSAFNLKQVRVTGSRISNALFGDDVKTTQILLNHLSVDTTDMYTHEGAAAAEQLALADQLEKRNRFIRTNGARDPRGQPTAPQGAATPGFVCADPFNPPLELQQDPGMCAAYGACPKCPLAGVDHTCPTSLALILRLRNQIKAAASSPDMDPYRWARVLKPRLIAIEQRWLPRFDDEVLRQASVLIRDVHVSPLPDISLE